MISGFDSKLKFFLIAKGKNEVNTKQVADLLKSITGFWDEVVNNATLFSVKTAAQF